VRIEKGVQRPGSGGCGWARSEAWTCGMAHAGATST
jgi:hypothetical protein